MNGKAVILATERVVFSVSPHERDISGVKTVDHEEKKVSATQIIIKESRFARLKRSLRKRSASIL